MIHYHISPIPLETGSIILPGNFGRIIRSQQGDGTPMLFREFIYEDIRSRFYSHKPSRMESIFLCQDVLSMWKFILATNSFSNLIYLVEVVTENKKQHVAPIDFVKAGTTPWTSVVENAHQYWKWDSSDISGYMIEVVTESPVRTLCRGVTPEEFQKKHNI